MNLWRPWNLFSTLETGKPFLSNFNSGRCIQNSQFRYWHVFGLVQHNVSNRCHSTTPVHQILVQKPKIIFSTSNIVTPNNMTIDTNIFDVQVTSAFDFYHQVRKLHFTRFLLFDFLAILEVFELRNEVSSSFKILVILCATLLLSNSQFRRHSCFCCSGFPNHAKSRLLVHWRHVAWQ